MPDSFKRRLSDIILLDSNVVDAHLEPCHSSILASAEPLVKDRHLFFEQTIDLVLLPTIFDPSLEMRSIILS